ncbi:hypothetical protein HKX54_08090 [Sulfitobacter sp. M57]|uniref:hypothetical protein n=1 Tax=unclassified Sulfitobacter TaxID=196795 RepID=UPI0023E18864|nr:MULTISPECIES: hypothetical protein [unclassified Sulfitobacter]MDF3414411.1 hypothetical protein [Sulfitobacter sp. KE5]MDF3421892.1 hypothetical protein [Sulfitobacter sp. KE43]MDF3432957.1 hypothetical protein [Sulfitobacter sp. KE42]MDF3458597.1 hypothetical protein [Sulfitobacter sp. S74]MDF3462497.1 hypothetical protein [Sulfitobacter sp. Ks18]
MNGWEAKAMDLDNNQMIALIGDVALPASIFLLGIIVSISLERLKGEVARRNFVIEKQYEVFAVANAQLNKIYQYCTYVGGWSVQSPTEIIALKRELDEVIFGSLPLMNDGLVEAYNEFMAACFDTKRGRSFGVAIKANRARFEENENWVEEWVDCFVEPNSLEIGAGSYRRDVVLPSYVKLLAEFSELLVGRSGVQTENLKVLLEN